MPIYVVRWPNLCASLIRATDEDDLIDTLDEVANPEGCTWKVYEGPIALDFDLPARAVVAEHPDADEAGEPRVERPLEPEDIRIEGTDELLRPDTAPMTVNIAGETGGFMLEAIGQFAFPAMARVYWGGDDVLDREQLERALTEDATPLIEASWRYMHMQRSTDPDVVLARSMDASVRWFKNRRMRQPGELDVIPIAEVIAAAIDGARAEWLDRHNSDQLRDLLVEVFHLLDEFDEQASADEP